MSEETTQDRDAPEEPSHVLRSFRVKNFKAIKDSGDVAFGPLTVLIGNNGSGKSSLVEALETYCDIDRDGLDEAMERWKGFEHIWHQDQRMHLKADPPPSDDYLILDDGELGGMGSTLRAKVGSGSAEVDISRGEILSFDGGTFPDARDRRGEAMSFILRMADETRRFEHEVAINTVMSFDEVLIEHERVRIDGTPMYERNAEGKVRVGEFVKGEPRGISEDDRWEDNSYPLDMMFHDRWDVFPNRRLWRLLSLDPVNMAEPAPVRRSASRKRLDRDGSNVAEYLEGIKKEDPEALAGIIETLLHILPFAKDLRAAKTSELQRTFYLQLTEKDYSVPGWLLSTGTLRLVALLALMRDPRPSRLIVIEEIENGLVS